MNAFVVSMFVIFFASSSSLLVFHMQETDTVMYANLRKVLDWQLLQFYDHDIHAAGSSPPSTLTENLNQTRYREELSALLLLNVWVNGYALLSLAMSVSYAVVFLWGLARSATEQARSLHGACVVHKQDMLLCLW